MKKDVWKTLYFLPLLLLLLDPTLYFSSEQFVILFARVSRVFKGIGATKIRVAVLECPGGTDKGPDGHRKDSAFLLDGLTDVGVDARIVQYTDATSSSLLFEVGSSVDAFISRVDPGEYDLCSEESYFQFLEGLMDIGVLAFNSPHDMLSLGSKKSLLNLAGLSYFPNSTYVYSSLDHFDAFFPKILKLHKNRVIKQNRGSKGEGVWWVAIDEDVERVETPARKLKNSASFKFLSFPFFTSFPSFSSFKSIPAVSEMEFTPNEPFFKYLLPGNEFLDPSRFSSFDYEDNFSFSSQYLSDAERDMQDIKVKLVEAKDNHEEKMDLLSFRNQIVKTYLKEETDFVLDMEFLPRIREGEVRLILSGKKVLYVVNKQVVTMEEDSNSSANSFSANLGAGAKHVWDSPELWGELVDPFLDNIDEMLDRLHVQNAPILWTVDFIRYGDQSEPGLVQFVISEINASCVGFSANAHLGKVIAEIFLETANRILGLS